MPLTALQCKNATREKDGGMISDGRGLHLKLEKNGAKYWRYKYRINGKEKVMAIGIYPVMSLAEARDKHMTAYKLVYEGIDPVVARKEQAKAKELKANNTFELIAMEWYEKNKPTWKEAYAEEMLKRLKKNFFPTLGSKPITDIDTCDIYNLATTLQERGANELAKRSVRICSKIFQFAMITRRADSNPTSELKGAIKMPEAKHYASIEISEIPELLKDIQENKVGLHRQTILSIKMMMLTFVRTGELIGAKWNEFDLDDGVWIIPASRMKMKKEHLVPLSKQTIQILEELRLLHSHPKYVFPGRNRRASHMSNNTILMALKRMGYGGIMTGHGFRSLAMSAIMEKLGYRHEVPDLQLAHTKRGSVDKAYNRAKFLDERKKMMQDWADYLDSLI